MCQAARADIEKGMLNISDQKELGSFVNALRRANQAP